MEKFNDIFCYFQHKFENYILLCFLPTFGATRLSVKTGSGWCLRALLGGSEGISWCLRALLGGSEGISWCLRALLEGSEGISWCLGALLGGSKGISWCLRALLGGSAGISSTNELVGICLALITSESGLSNPYSFMSS